MVHIIWKVFLATVIVTNSVALWLLLREVYRELRKNWRKKRELRKL